MNIAILLFEEADLLDAGGPYEVFLTASRLVERDGQPSPFAVSTVSIDDKPVTAYGGMGLIPSGTAADLAQSDLLIVPGTINIDRAVNNQALVKTIQQFYATRKDRADPVIASVCTGAFLLAEACILENLDWTTHWEDVDLLAEKIGSIGATRQVRWVDSGNVLTSAGLSAGIDLALHLVQRFSGLELAQRTAKQIDYHWHTQ